MFVLSLLLLSAAFAQTDEGNVPSEGDKNPKVYSMSPDDLKDTGFDPENMPRIKGVLQLSDIDFLDAIEHWPNMIVAFIETSCPHTDAVIEILNKEVSSINLVGGTEVGFVNCRNQHEICTAYRISSYPTIMYLFDGQEVRYTGAHTQPAVSEWVNKKIRDVNVLQTHEPLEMLSVQSSLYVVFFGEKDTPEYNALNKAVKYIDDIVVIGTNVKESLEAFKIEKTPTLVFYKKKINDKQNVIYSGDWTAQDIERFIFVESVKWYNSEFKPRHLDLMFTYKVPVLFLVGDYERLGNSIAQKYKGMPVVVSIDFTKEALPRLAQYFGINPRASKYGLIVDVRDGDESDYRKYLTEGLVSEDNLVEFVDKFLAGELKPMLKSEKVPESNAGPIQKIVGSNFESVVGDTGKDVMVLFQAPWCNHCREFVETYTTLQELKPDITFTEIDVNFNDVLDHPITHFPTIKFFPKYNKQGLVFTEERTLDNFVQFIETELETKTPPVEKSSKSVKSGKKEEL